MGRPPDPGRRDEVLDQAIAYLADHGLTALSLRRLATAIGTSTNVISYQFGSREGLVDAALTRARAESLRMLDVFRTDHPDATVADGFRAIWDWWMERPFRIAYSRLNMEAMMTEHAVDAERRADLLEFWVEYFADWMIRDGCERTRARALSTAMLAIQSGLTIDLLSTGNRERIESAVDAFEGVLAAAVSRAS